MKNFFTEHRYAYFGNNPEQSAAPDSQKERESKKIDTPKEAAQDIKNTIDKTDAATKNELAKMGVKIEKPLDTNTAKAKKNAEKETKNQKENTNNTEKGKDLNESFKEFAKVLAEVIRAISEAIKEFNAVKNGSKGETNERSQIDTRSNAKGESTTENEKNPFNPNLTEKEQAAIQKFRNKETGNSAEENNKTKEKVASLNKEKSDLRITENNLEKQKDELQTQLDNEELNTPPNKEVITSLEQKITKINSDIQDVKGKIASIDNQITEAKANKKQGEQPDPDLESAKNKLKQSVDAMNQKLEEVASKIQNTELQKVVRGIKASLDSETLEISVTLNAEAINGLTTIAEQKNIQKFTDIDSQGKVGNINNLLNFINKLNDDNQSGASETAKNTDQKETSEKPPRQALVESTREAMQQDQQLNADMKSVFNYFEKQGENVPKTYAEMEIKNPDAYYTMALSAAKLDNYAFRVAKIDPKTIAAARETIRNNPQGTYDFIKEVMQGLQTTPQPETIVSKPNPEPAPTVTANEPGIRSTQPSGTNEKPSISQNPTPERSQAPEINPTITTNEQPTEPATTEKNTLAPEAVQNLKNALGEMANTLRIDQSGQARIDVSSSTDNELLQKGILVGLDALKIEHSNGVISVNKENISTVISNAEGMVKLIKNMQNGNFADVPEEVKQNIINNINERLPANLRGKISIQDGNIAFAGGEILQKPLAKLAISKAGLQGDNNGNIIITPKNIAVAISALTAASSFLSRQEN